MTHYAFLSPGAGAKVGALARFNTIFRKKKEEGAADGAHEAHDHGSGKTPSWPLLPLSLFHVFTFL
jgi:hypothetical protein